MDWPSWIAATKALKPGRVRAGGLLGAHAQGAAVALLDCTQSVSAQGTSAALNPEIPIPRDQEHTPTAYRTVQWGTQQWIADCSECLLAFIALPDWP
jgi:hypothetical protein